MTIRVPPIALTLVMVALGFAAMSFGIAFAVTEWRQSGYIDCIVKAEGRYLDQIEPHRAARPDYTGSSEDAYEQYRRQYDKWQEAGDAISQGWVDEMRACS